MLMLWVNHLDIVDDTLLYGFIMDLNNGPAIFPQDIGSVVLSLSLSCLYVPFQVNIQSLEVNMIIIVYS